MSELKKLEKMTILDKLCEHAISFRMVSIVLRNAIAIVSERPKQVERPRKVEATLPRQQIAILPNLCTPEKNPI